MIAPLLAAWTLPLDLQVGSYFLYLGLIAAGTWQWWRKRPRQPTAPDASAAPPDDPDLPPPASSSPAAQ